VSIEFFEDIFHHKKRLHEQKREFFSSLKTKLGGKQASPQHSFRQSISRPGQVNLIAEIKKASPSHGIIREDFSLLDIAKTYVEHKAAAISILTEDKYFLGEPVFVKQVSDHFDVPVLTKDFIIDEGQIYEARLNGASAVLLIVALLGEGELKKLMGVATFLGLDCLVEVHDEEELKRALNCGAEIIGVNNRNLRTLEVDIHTCERIIPKIPKTKVIVAESGIKTHEEVQLLKGLGANAVLIGEAFMKEKDIGKKIQEVMYGSNES